MTDETQHEVKPGDDTYQIADRPFRADPREGSPHDATTILSALERASREGVAEASRHGHGLPGVIQQWMDRDAGEDPAVEPEEAFDRMRHAYASLPDDVRCEFAAEAERALWNYLQPDIEHLRIVRQREAEERQREEAEKAEQERQRRIEHEEADRKWKEQHAARQEEIERLRREREEEEARQRAESEAARRASEAARRGEVVTRGQVVA